MAQVHPVAAQRKYFSVEDANRTLPLVRAIVGDIVQQFHSVDNLRRRLLALAARDRHRHDSEDDPYLEERLRSEQELESEETKLREFVEELERLGVELKGPEGLCDFPSLRDGREIYLCWRLGEPEVLYWHEQTAGFGARQPLKPPAGKRSGKQPS